MSRLGNLFIVAAPSGAGKTTLVKALVESAEKIQISVSYTTRSPRQGEIDGKDYNFVSEEQFHKMTKDRVFWEHAEVFGYHYGTSHDWVIQQLDQGIDVILEIDWQGARQIRELFPAAVSLFILPPSMQVLRERLEKRRQDSYTVIAQRMQAAQAEISHYSEFDYLIVNDDFNVALNHLRAIVQAVQLRTLTQQKRLTSLLADLLEKQ